MKKTSWGFEPELSDMIGKVFTSVEQVNDDLVFTCLDGVFTFTHNQNCCESVDIESIVGDLGDLVGSPLLLAEESTSDSNPEGVAVPEYQDSFTWTFYKFATIKGYVDVRWYGSSNGYYSERVDLEFKETK